MSVRGHIIRGQYPPDWPVIALRAKEKAGWRCERCRHPAEGPWKTGKGALAVLARRAPYELDQSKGLGRRKCDSLCRHPHDGKQRVLTVDHLLGDKGMNQWWALAALCQVCHLQFQGRVRVEQGWAFEVSDWLKPHLAGYFAWRVSGQKLTREQVQESMDRYLSLGLPHYAGGVH